MTLINGEDCIDDPFTCVNRPVQCGSSKANCDGIKLALSCVRVEGDTSRIEFVTFVFYPNKT